VSFTGQVADASPYYALMDVFVNASTEEPFGLVVLEAMAAGVPVVAVDAAGPREILEPGRTGMLVPSNAPAELAGAIAPLLDDAGSRERMASAARQRFEERFTARRMAHEMDRVLVEMAARGPGE
jgi:glycogen(starch) synthase